PGAIPARLAQVDAVQFSGDQLPAIDGKLVELACEQLCQGIAANGRGAADVQWIVAVRGGRAATADGVCGQTVNVEGSIVRAVEDHGDVLPDVSANGCRA